MKTWILDQAHSELAFKVKHLMISTVRGTFKAFEGTISATDDTFTDAQISFSADAASINTNNDHRDKHLISADFFDVENYAKITFNSTSVKKEENNLSVVGDLTVKGITKQIEFKLVFNGTVIGMDTKRVASFELNTKINRQDFGLTWNAALEAGGVAVSDEVAIEAMIEVKEE